MQLTADCRQAQFTNKHLTVMKYLEYHPSEVSCVVTGDCVLIGMTDCLIMPATLGTPRLLLISVLPLTSPHCLPFPVHYWSCRLCTHS